MMMSNQMLILFAIFAERMNNGHKDNEGVEKAMAVFAFLLFLTYLVLSVLLLVYQKDIVRDGEKYIVWCSVVHLYYCLLFWLFISACLMICWLLMASCRVSLCAEAAPISNTAGGGAKDAHFESAEAGDDDLPPENI
jgi:hypothetical protein